VRSFFSSYASADQTCTVSTKACLAVFRQVGSVEKATVRVEQECIAFELQCLHAVKKSYKIPFEESSRRAVDVDGVRPHRFSGTPKQFAEYVSNFHTSIPEITIAPSRTKVALQSFLSGQVNQGEFARVALSSTILAPSAEGVRALYTQMELPAAAFSDYNVKSDEQIHLTVSLRELKVRATSRVVACDAMSA
jgi:hypothetical protein